MLTRKIINRQEADFFERNDLEEMNCTIFCEKDTIIKAKIKGKRGRNKYFAAKNMIVPIRK